MKIGLVKKPFAIEREVEPGRGRPEKGRASGSRQSASSSWYPLVNHGTFARVRRGIIYYYYCYIYRDHLSTAKRKQTTPGLCKQLCSYAMQIVRIALFAKSLMLPTMESRSSSVNSPALPSALNGEEEKGVRKN